VLSLLAAALYAQAPAPAPHAPVAVLATSKRPSVDQYVATLTARAHALFEKEGIAPLLDEASGIHQLKVAGVTDSRTCQGGTACVARLALILGEHAVVVGIDVGKAGPSLAVLMEAVAADTKQPLLTSEFSVPIAKYSDECALPLTVFARQLKAKLDAENPAPVKVVEPLQKPPPDAPVVAKIEPPPPALVIPVEAPSSGRKVGGWLTAGGAVVGLGVGIALAVVGTGAKGQIDASVTAGTPPSSSLPASQLKGLESQANGAFTGALISGIAAAVFAAVSIYLFASST
jgi:hypothetical protein